MHVEPDPGRRTDDGRLELVGSHRQHVDDRGGEELGEVGVEQRAVVVVGTQREHDGRSSGSVTPRTSRRGSFVAALPRQPRTTPRTGRRRAPHARRPGIQSRAVSFHRPRCAGGHRPAGTLMRQHGDLRSGFSPGTPMPAIPNPRRRRSEAGISPAATTLDFPDPDGPTRASRRWPRRRGSRTASTSASRPKKSSASATGKGRSPLNGLRA